MSSQEKIAYHVVLLFPENVNQMSFDLNSKLVVEEGADQFTLDNDMRPPHMTLGVGVVSADKIEELNTKMGELAEKYQGLEVEIRGVYGHHVTGFKIALTETVMNFHRDVVAIFDQYRIDEVRPEHFFNEEIDDKTANHVTIFKNERSGENFFPHITLGKGQLPDGVDTGVSLVTKPTILATGQMGKFGCFMKRFKEFNL